MLEQREGFNSDLGGRVDAWSEKARNRNESGEIQKGLKEEMSEKRKEYLRLRDFLAFYKRNNPVDLGMTKEEFDTSVAEKEVELADLRSRLDVLIGHESWME